MSWQNTRAAFGVVFDLNVYNYPEDVVGSHEMEDLVKSLLPEQQGWGTRVCLALGRIARRIAFTSC